MWTNSISIQESMPNVFDYWERGVYVRCMNLVSVWDVHVGKHRIYVSQECAVLFGLHKTLFIHNFLQAWV